MNEKKVKNARRIFNNILTKNQESLPMGYRQHSSGQIINPRKLAYRRLKKSMEGI